MAVCDAEPVIGASPTPALSALVAVALDGLALLDDDGCYTYVNPAGCRILGVPAEDLVGRPAVFGSAAPPDGVGRIVRWRAPRSGRERDLEYRTTRLDPAGPCAAAVAFRDVTELRLQQRRFTAFTAAAANVADAGSLRESLDAICAEVVRTTDLAAAQILLMDADGVRMRVHGAAPSAAWPDNFGGLLEEARRRGARLSSLEAFRTRRPAVHRHRKAALLADPAWAPLHAQLDGFEWDTMVSVPLLAHGTALGALNAYYHSGHDPDGDETAFLASMADHAALAVENGRLLAESRGRAALAERHRLARELHDSACQQMFSMTLHIRVAELALSSGRPEDEATRRSLQTLDRLARAALEDMRALIFELRPTLLHTEGLVSVLRQQAASATARLALPITVDAPDERLDLDPDVEIDAYRLVQEALHNCMKHAEAASVRIRIGPDALDARTLVLEVIDDGRGIDGTPASGGLGLLSMHERAEQLGGELTITGRPGEGTVVRAVVPRVLPPVARPPGQGEP